MRNSLRLCVWLLASASTFATVSLRSQSVLPTRLLQAGDLVHQGSFTIPNMTDVAPIWTGQTMACEYVQGVIAYNPANNSLYLVCHDWSQSVAEISIPALGGVATQLQQPRDPLEGHMIDINPTDPNSKKIGGLYVSGSTLVVAAYSYYDGSVTAVASHFTRPTNLATAGQVKGPVAVGSDGIAFTAGYLGVIPSAWQSSLGGDFLSGQCCLSVISRTSEGPAVSSLSLANVLALQNPVPAKQLVAYPQAHPTLGNLTPTTQYFGNGTGVRGVVMPNGTASVLFFGRYGSGAYCYGPGTSDQSQAGQPADGGVDTYCYDPTDSSKGGHAYPYIPRVWAYNANDLAAVKAGTKHPWDLLPYAMWQLTDLQDSHVAGAAYDPATGRIFVTEQMGDGTKPRIHVYSINGGNTGSATTDITPPTVAIASPTPGATVSGTATLTATASDDTGVSSVWFTVDGTTVGAEVPASPFQQAWDSTGVSNGSHTLQAMARDAAGNVGTSSSVTVTVNNTVADTDRKSVV